MSASNTANKVAATFACNPCRLGKRKCDATRPKCSRCERQNKPCTYTGETRVRRRKYWDEDYVKSLEHQVRTLLTALKASNKITTEQGESLSTEIPDLSNSPEAVQPGLDPILEDGLVLESPEHKISDYEDRSVSAMEELSVMMWRTNIGDGVSIVNDYSIGPSQSIRSTESVTDAFVPPPISIVNLCQDTALLEELTTLFLDNINLERQFTPYRSSSERFLSGYPYQDPSKTFLHTALLATGACFSQRKDALLIGDTFAEYAESQIFTCFRQHPTIQLVQGLCMLSWRSLALGRDHFGWTFISMAAGMCVHLRLHVLALEECAARSWQPAAEDIRTFWMFYLIDRTAISILGRNCVLPWRRVNVPDFDKILGEGDDLATVSFAWQCKLWFWHDERMDQIFAAGFEMLPTQQQAHLLVAIHEALGTFFKTRDPRLDFIGMATDRNVLFFHMAYQMALLVTLPPFLRCFAKTAPHDCDDAENSAHLMLILDSITNAASTMVRLVRTYRDAHLHDWCYANPVVIHHLLSAVIVHMMNATSKSSSLKAQSARWLRLSFELLSQLESQWPNRVKKTIKVIRVLAQRWGVLGALPMRFSYCVNPESRGTQSGIPDPGDETSVDINTTDRASHEMDQLGTAGFDTLASTVDVDPFWQMDWNQISHQDLESLL